jgi:hypothetical protein
MPLKHDPAPESSAERLKGKRPPTLAEELQAEFRYLSMRQGKLESWEQGLWDTIPERFAIALSAPQPARGPSAADGSSVPQRESNESTP